MSPVDYVAVANRKFSEVGRSVIPNANSSRGYFNKEYNPITANYVNNHRNYKTSALEYSCNNCYK